MSFLKRLFGGGSFADERSDADRSFDEGRYAEARISYERAIELAAPHVRALPVERIASLLDDRFRLLAGKRRGLFDARDVAVRDLVVGVARGIAAE